MAAKRINELTNITGVTVNPTDRFPIDRSIGGGSFKTLYINGQQIINTIIANIPTNNNAYIFDLTTKSIKSKVNGIIATGKYSYASGFDTKAEGDYSFIHSQNSTTIGDNSAILGGESNTTTGKRSVVLGGQNIDANVDDTVYVPNLNINTPPGTDISVDDLLIIDTNGDVKKRGVSTLNISGTVIEKTYSEMVTLKSTSMLKAGSTYHITGRDIWIYAINENTLDTNCLRLFPIIKSEFYEPHINNEREYLGIYGQTITKELVPNSTPTHTYFAIWGGKLWQRDEAGMSVPGSSNQIIQSGWTMVDITNYTFYNRKIFNVLYDFDNNVINQQSDNRGNIIINNPISLSEDYINMTDWGNEYIKYNKCFGIFNNFITNRYIVNNIILGNIFNNHNSGVINSNSIDGEISNNSNDGEISGNTNVGYISNNSNGGYISGNSNDGEIGNNSNYGEISNNSNVGYIFNNSNGGYISGNSNGGNIISNSNNSWINYNSNGGDISYNKNTSFIASNFNNGAITQNTSNVTQIAYNFNNGNINNNENNGLINRNSNNGVISYNSNVGEISNNSNDGVISNNSNVGYIFNNSNGGNISNNNNDGEISGNSNGGYISGNSNGGNISINRNSGNIYGNRSVNGTTFNINQNKNNGDIKQLNSTSNGNIYLNVNNGNIGIQVVTDFSADITDPQVDKIV